MTPLLGTKNPSAPVGDKSGGERRAARALLSCSSWRGMGRQWRGMGGMGRAEPLAEQHPHQQQGHSGFHGSRETSQETRNAAFDGRSSRHGCGRVTSRKTAARSLLLCALWRDMGRQWRGMGGMGRPKQLSAHHPHRQQGHSGFHETRITAFFRITAFLPCRQTGDARRRAGPQASRVDVRSAGKRVERSFSESRFGSRFGIRHNSSQFVGKIRISPCRPSSAPAHCGNRDIGFMDASRPRLTFPGPQVSPSGDVKGERATNRETQPLTRRAAQASPSSEVFTKHETRNTNHGFFSNHGFFLACFGGRVVRNAG